MILPCTILYPPSSLMARCQLLSLCKNETNRSFAEISQELLFLSLDDSTVFTKTGKCGSTPLHYCVVRGDAQLVELMVRLQGGTVDIPNKSKETPLHWACREGNLGAVECLLSHGACMVIKDRRGVTPLQIAQESGNLELIQLMEAHDPTAPLIPDPCAHQKFLSKIGKILVDIRRKSM